MTEDQYWGNDAFCPLPWTSIYVEPDGLTDTCCIARNRLGNIKNNAIEEIINSDYNIGIRKNMLDGKRVDGCSRCYPPKNLAIGDNAGNINNYLRYIMLNIFKHLDKTIYDNPDKFELRYADLRFRNTCNYACVYCSEDLSSTWAAEKKIFPVSDDAAISKLIQYFCDNAATLEKIYMAGGEPLLIKENEIILERLLEVNPNCKILVNTNLSMIENNKIFNLLLKFKNVMWLISAEDMYERYEYIRYPGVWSTFDTNLKFLKNNIPKTQEIAFNMVYLALNTKSFFNFVDYLFSLGFTRENLNVNYINGGHHPSYLDPRMLPKTYIKDTIEIAERYAGEDRFGTNVRVLIDFLKTGVIEHHDIFKFFEETDLSRNLDSKKVFSDIYEYRQ